MNNDRSDMNFPNIAVSNYFDRLADKFFKILPMREEWSSTLPSYMSRLRGELLGLKDLFEQTHNDPKVISILSILQFLIYDIYKVPLTLVKREIFEATTICNELSFFYGAGYYEKESVVDECMEDI